jgi:hypothetical protein
LAMKMTARFPGGFRLEDRRFSVRLSRVRCAYYSGAKRAVMYQFARGSLGGDAIPFWNKGFR